MGHKDPLIHKQTVAKTKLKLNKKEKNNPLIGKVGNGGPILTSFSSRRRLHRRRRRYRFSEQFRRQIRNSFKVKSIEQLKRKDELLQFHLTGNSFENSRSTGHRQIRIFVSQVWSLNCYVSIISEIKAVNCFVSIAFLLRFVFY